MLSLLTYATYAATSSETLQLKEEIAELRSHLASKTTEDIVAIAADTGSITEFMDELYGLTWKSHGLATNGTANKRHLPLYFENGEHSDNGAENRHGSRRDTEEEPIEKKKMKEFSIFSNAQPSEIDGSLEAGNIFIQAGTLYDREGYITGQSDLACTFFFEDSDGDTNVDELLCNAIFIFTNKYGFEVGQLHLQGIIRGLSVLDGTATNSGTDLFAVIGGTGCFAGAKGIATYEQLPFGSVWYTKKHDFFLYEYWVDEYEEPTNTYPF